MPRGPRRRRAGFTPQEHSGNNSSELKKKENIRANHVYEKPKYTGGLWTDDDILELIKLVKKYPGGTPDRWEKIAETMNRSVNEVTHMAKKIKDEGLKPNQTAEEPSVVQQPKKIKTRAENPESDVVWSQEEQKALEAALLKYPKSSSVDRWEKIANCIEGKTKVRIANNYLTNNHCSHDILSIILIIFLDFSGGMPATISSTGRFSKKEKRNNPIACQIFLYEQNYLKIF